jgi:hypothetical protein
MKEKIFAFLKTRLTGVPDNYLLGVADHYSKTVTEETKIEATFTDGVIDFIKHNAAFIQSEGDKRATTAAETALKNYRERHGLDENGKPIKTKPKKKRKEVDDSDEEEVPAWAAELKELKEELENIKKEKTANALIDKVKSHDKLKEIPASFLKGRNLIPQSEGEIEQLAASIEADYSAFKQEMAEKGVVISAPPVGGGSVKEGETLGKSIAEKKNANASEGVKGKAI